MQRLALLIISMTCTLHSIVAQQSEVLPLIHITSGHRTVRTVLDEISEQSGLDFSYNAKALDDKQTISYEADGITLAAALRTLCKQVKMRYSLLDNQIILSKPGLLARKIEKTPNYFNISGFVQDRSTGESLIGATVSVRGSSKGSVTNGFGYYTLQLPEGQYELSFAYIGYQEETWRVTVQGDQRKRMTMAPTPLELPSIIVTLPHEYMTEKRDPEHGIMKPEALGNMPEFAGESGLIKGLQALPGVKMHSDGSAFFYIRGGEKDQNLIIIDDAPIFNPAHLLGFYSMVIPDFTKEIKVYKSDVPTYLGDRLSSIVSIRTKDGNLNNWQLSGSINPLVNRLSLEVPTSKGRGSFFTSLRRSNFEWIYKETNPDDLLQFGDFNLKWNHRFNDKNRLFFTLITGVDALSNQTESVSGINWANVATTLRWNHVFSPKLFSNTTIYSGAYNYRLFFNDNAWESGIGTVSLKSDFTHFVNPRVESRFGLELSGYGFNPGKLSSGNLLSLVPVIDERVSRKRAWYYESEYQPSSKWHFKAGLRMATWENYGPSDYFTYAENGEVSDTFSQPKGVYHTSRKLDPRLSIKYGLDSTSYVKVSYGRYHQFLQLITNSVSPFTSLEVWLPSGPNIQPQFAHQATLGYLKYFAKTGWTFSVSSYYKKMQHQIDYAPHARTLLNPQVEGELRFGQADAYGFEVQLKKELGRLNGWANYTWSRAMRKTAQINQGHRYPAFQDRPHDFSMLINYQLNKRILLSTYLTAYTGSTFSSPTGFYRFKEQMVPIYDYKNNDRLPNYRRIDFAFRFRLNKRLESKYQHSLTFSIYNALAHKNIVAVNFNKILGVDDNPVVQANFLYERDLVATQTDLIRFVPSLTYKFQLR